MNPHRRGVWTLGGLLCAVLIVWGIKVGDGRESVVSAQQDNWTTEAARRQGIRFIETRDASGPLLQKLWGRISLAMMPNCGRVE